MRCRWSTLPNCSRTTACMVLPFRPSGRGSDELGAPLIGIERREGVANGERRIADHREVSIDGELKPGARVDLGERGVADPRLEDRAAGTDREHAGVGDEPGPPVVVRGAADV